MWYICVAAKQFFWRHSAESLVFIALLVNSDYRCGCGHGRGERYPEEEARCELFCGVVICRILILCEGYVEREKG